jgi:putative peptidoglycan lipid II flippase
MKALANTYRQHWLRWSEASVNRRIFAAAVTVGLSTLAVNLAFVLRDAGIAAYFGRGDEVDAVLIAYLLPSFTINIIAGSFSAAFIPTYVQVREHQGDPAADRLFSGVMIGGLGLLIAVAALLAVASGSLLPFLASGFSDEKRALTRSLFLLFLPLLVLGGIANLWSSLLNARKRFVIGALAPIMPPLAALAGLFAAGTAWGIYALAAGSAASFCRCCAGSSVETTGGRLLPAVE